MKINIITTRDSGPHKHSIDIPTGWNGKPPVTFRQYLGIIKAGNDINELLSVFTELDPSVIKKAQIKNLGAVTACLHFLKSPPVYRTPAAIMGHRIAKNLEGESTAQYADLQQILGKMRYVDETRKELTADDIIFNYNFYPLIVATYAIVPYDFKQAEALAPKLFNAPCTEVLAVGNFTRVRLHALNSGIVPTSPPTVDTLRNRFKQALIDWLGSLASSIRYNMWKRSLPLNERNYLNGQ